MGHDDGPQHQQHLMIAYLTHLGMAQEATGCSSVEVLCALGADAVQHIISILVVTLHRHMA